MMKKINFFIFMALIQYSAYSQETSKDSSLHMLEEVEISKPSSGESSIKLIVPLKDIPLTTNIVSSETLRRQGSDDMISALKNVSGVYPIATYGGFQQFIIRGFSDFLLLVDGFRDERHNISESAPMSNTASIERIEVLKGPNSVLYGHSALGGVINIIRKKPSRKQTFDFLASYGSFNTRRLRGGAGGPIGHKFFYRLDIGLSQDQGWRNAGSDRSTGYLALDYVPDDKNLFQLQFSLSKDAYRNDAGIPVINGKIPEHLNLSSRYNAIDDHLNYKRADINFKYTHIFSKVLKLSNTTSYAIDDINYLSTESLVLNAAMDSVTRGYFNFNHQTKPFQNTIELNMLPEILGLKQQLVIGYSMNYLNRSTYYDDPLRNSMASTLSLINPTESQSPVHPVNTDAKRINEYVHGIYLQDWFDINKRIKLLAGLRYDIIDAAYRSDKLPTSSDPLIKGVSYTPVYKALTYRLGGLYKATDKVSLYGSYSTYFKQPRQIPSNDKKLKPESGYQTEAGIRLNPIEPFSVNVAAFYIHKNDMVVGLGKGLFDQAGAAVSKGIEIDFSVQPINGFQLTAGYSFVNAQYTNYVQGTTDYKGKKLQYAPNHQVNIWSSYSLTHGFLKGLGLGLGGNYFGLAYTDSDNSVKMPAYFVINTTAFYRMGKAEINLNLNNILNEKYIVSAINGNQLYPGAPTNLLLSVRYLIQ
jgi:iron complex outermembrane receptor protein